MRIIALCLLLAAAPAGAHAQDMRGDVAKGRAIAEELCSPCHSVGETGRSRNASAPPFREVVTRYPVSHLEEALAEGIMVGHDAQMPQFTFAPEQIDNLLSYLDQLAPE